MEFMEIPCKTWACVRCGENILRPRLIAAIASALTTHQLNQYVTLTLGDKQIHNIEKATQKLMKAWRGMRYQYKRKFGSTMTAIWVKEITRGRPHLHVFTKNVRPTWLRREWHKRTGGQQVKISTIDPETHERISGYTVKSIRDNAIEYDQTLGRWCGTSQDIKLGLNDKKAEPEDEDAPAWELCKRPRLDRIDRERLEVLWEDKAFAIPRPTRFIIYPETSEHQDTQPCLF